MKKEQTKYQEKFEYDNKNSKNKFSKLKQFPCKLVNNLKNRKNKKRLLNKITSGEIPSKDEYKFIISLPEKDLQKFCEKIKGGAESHRFTIGMLIYSHNMNKNDPDIQELLKTIESINSVLKYISNKTNIKIEPVETNFLFKKTII